MRPIRVLFALLCIFSPFVHADTLATVNGSPITSDDLQHAVREFAGSRGARPEQLQQSPQFEQLKQMLLRSLVERELLWQAARKQHQVNDQQVADAVARVRTQLGGEDRLKQALQAQGLTEESIAQRLRQDLSIQAYLQQEVYAAISVSDADVRDFYETNRAQFRSPDLLHLRDIIVSPSAGDAQKIAAQMHQKLTQGADFPQMARKHSADVSSRSGGDLGYLNAQDLGDELAPVAEAMTVGAISEPHAGPDGIHLLQLIARHPGYQASLADVHDRIHDQLLETRRKQALQQRVQQLRAKAKIERLK